ncbi:MAG TPA: L-histidine N(alpha)-methyltransferase [Terriglobales bacterium]|nr:L-histidine N(alpha)-methyltransferase [Terriglobales bacterium]
MAPRSGTGPKMMDSPKALKITALLREYEIVDRVQKSFRERQLPEEIFYWFPSSVKAWVDLCRSTEYRNANRAIEVLNVAAPEIAERIERPAAVCGLGCGEASKDAVLLRAFQARGNHPEAYLGADFSQALLELAMEELKPYVPQVSGVKCDLGDDQHLATVCSMAIGGYDAPVIFTVLGNTLGAFGPAQFPQRLRRHLRVNDWFIFDGEIFSEFTLAGYDNPTNRRFAWGPLNGVGITESDGQLDFAAAAAGNGLFTVTKQFTASRNLRISLGGEALEINGGEKLRMSSSIKYADETALFRALEAANFRTERRWESADGKFVLGCAKAV